MDAEIEAALKVMDEADAAWKASLHPGARIEAVEDYGDCWKAGDIFEVEYSDEGARVGKSLFIRCHDGPDAKHYRLEYLREYFKLIEDDASKGRTG